MEDKEICIKVQNLTKDYKKGKGIFDFSFEVKKGEIFGLVGTNGSGKTTTMRHLMGFIKGDSGKCYINGYDCWKNADKVKKIVGYVPGQIDFPDVGTGTDFLKSQAQLLKLKDLSYMNYLIDKFKIDITAPLKRMSKGMKQKMGLVAAFMTDADVYLLDEPSTGLDPLMRDTLIEIILEQKQKGRTIFMSSHIFKELEDTCDTVLFIENGKIVNLVRRSQFEEAPKEQFTIGFKTEKDMKDFININKNRKNLSILNTFELKNEVIVNLVMYKVNEFLEELANYDLSYLNNDPYTLEDYYINIIKNGGKKNV